MKIKIQLIFTMLLLNCCVERAEPIGPTRTEQEKAVAVVWENWLHMTLSDLPLIKWQESQQCSHYNIIELQVTVPGTCSLSTVIYDKNTRSAEAFIWWPGRISDSDFAYALGKYSSFLLTGEWTPHDALVVNQILTSLDL